MGDVLFFLRAPAERPASQEEISDLLEMIQGCGLPGSGLTARQEEVLIEALYGLLLKKLDEIIAQLPPKE